MFLIIPSSVDTVYLAVENMVNIAIENNFVDNMGRGQSKDLVRIG